MDRRQFIVGVAGLAASSVAEAGPRGMRRVRREKLKLGILGVGMRGQVHLAELLRRDDVAITAICDIDPFM
ncbi:MAG: gfo/Idh/MocA family oxidoreductase, partial [Alphaproteobacteria bacterium]